MTSYAPLPLLLAACLAVFTANGCNDHSSSSSSRRGGESGSPQTGLPTTQITIGNQQFTLEIASTDKAREIGLMYRDSMPADHGMIFVFPTADERTFWMKHTRIPLDILYVATDGRVVSVRQMQPFDLTGVPSNGPAKYAIELNQGAANAAGVKAGDQLQIPPAVTSLTPEASQ
jgi:uncharacterized membrane protein (UPF0127 family)